MATDYEFLSAQFAENFPLLSYGKHKGQYGRLTVIGGSESYSGAPYFTAASALRMGADLCRVICTSSAAVAIKSYSPDIIVHPWLADTKTQGRWEDSVGVSFQSHCVVLGPGLGVDKYTHWEVQHILKKLLENHKQAPMTPPPVVIDADFVATAADLLKSKLYGRDLRCVMTPNANEMKKLEEKMGISNKIPPDFLDVLSDYRRFRCIDSSVSQHLEMTPQLKLKMQRVAEISRALNNVTILCKGSIDIISNGDACYAVNTVGSFKRSAGQGDILAGVIGTILSWENLHHYSSESSNLASLYFTQDIALFAAVCGSIITRTASRLAFLKYHRGMTASNVLEFVTKAFEESFPDLPHVDHYGVCTEM